jgi:hypothetical protein
MTSFLGRSRRWRPVRDEFVQPLGEMLDSDDHPTEHVHRIALISMIVLQLLNCWMKDLVDFGGNGHLDSIRATTAPNPPAQLNTFIR